MHGAEKREDAFTMKAHDVRVLAERWQLLLHHGVVRFVDQREVVFVVALTIPERDWRGSSSRTANVAGWNAYDSPNAFTDSGGPLSFVTSACVITITRAFAAPDVARS